MMAASLPVPGTLFIVAAPSGGGKTSLVKRLVQNLPEIEVSISHTTRDKRPGETDGVHYFFVSEATFLDMIQQQAFIEHAQVFEHYYGTSVVQVRARLEAGIDVVLDIDWQGAQQIKHLFPQSVSIFILPPSLEALHQRLESRQRDSAEVIQRRMARACDELSHYAEFDYLVVNDSFEQAAQDLQAIVISQRLQISRQVKKQQQLLSFLLTTR